MWPSRSTYRIIIVLIVFQANSCWSLSDKRLCADPKCQEVISLGRAKLGYTAAEKGRVSFKINSNIRIKSKSAGSDKSLWGIEVNGRQGYAPKEFIVEEKILVKEKDVKYEIPVEGFEDSAKQAIDVPSVKLNPSEVTVKEKVKATETPQTVPLDSATEATPLPLNASENEVETTTAPLTVEDAKIVNQSMRDMVTPVLNNFEIIDGTAIPIIEDVVPKASIDSTSAETGNESNEHVTTKPDTISTPSLEINSETLNQAIPEVKSDEQIKDNEAIEEETNVFKDEIGTTNINEQAKNIVVDAARTNAEQLEQTSKKTTTTTQPKIAVGVAAAEANADQIDEATIMKQETVGGVESIKGNSEQLEKVSKDSTTILQQESAPNKVTTTTKQQDAAIDAVANVDSTNQGVESNNVHTPINTNTENVPTSKKSNLEDLTKVESAKNVETPQIMNSTPPPTVAQQGIEDTNETVSFNDEDDDVDEDDDDDDEDDKEIYKNIPSSSIESVTTKTPQAYTDSGYETMPNRNYWEEEIVTTTPAPKIAVKEETPEINSEVEAKETTPKASVTESAYMQPTTETPGAVEERVEVLKSEVVESTTLEPQVSITESSNMQPTIKTPDAVEERVEVLNNEAVESTTLKPQMGITESVNMEFTTETPNAVEERVEILNNEAVESTTLKPQVPSMPVTLPIFQQPTLPPPIHQEHQHVQHAEYDNPNDYYREKNLKLQAEINSEINTLETSSSYPTEHNYPDTMPVSNEKYPTASTEQNVDVQKNDESSNKREASIEMIPSIPSLLEQHTEVPAYMLKEEKREAGLFTTILGTVNTFVNKLRKEPIRSAQEDNNEDEQLQQILYPDRFSSKKDDQQGEQYCEKLSSHQCPHRSQQHIGSSVNSFENQQCHYDWSHINMDNFIDIFLAKAFEMRELLSCLSIAATASLVFLFGYYCFCNSNREGALISKLNQLERSLLASHKENAILKDDLLKTRNKLISIEDNSFGSNDMVIALKKELDVLSAEKRQLQEHVHSLEKELETAAEAGLELNKIVAELLNNQTGQESMIMNSVEDLQMQFNEQQKTILDINANLAEKSRENSELQLMLAEQNVRFSGEIASLQQDNDELEAEKANLQTRMEELKTEFEEDITKALDGKNVEIKRLQNEILEIRNRFEDIHTKWQTSLAKIEALEDCMRTMKRDPGVNISEVINAANVKAELLDLQHQRASLKSLLDTETEARQHAESSLKNTISEVDRLKQDFHQSEKDKLEAQTRLEVLSNYFKEKETQLQKELSLKEAIWLKQQGENTSTVDRMTALQEEIQSLKSQNDALRAEIEAQIAAHKAQTGTLENRAHETWLAARQSERRYEEARAEAAALRRRLTELAGATSSSDPNRAAGDNKMPAELTNAPSPILPPSLMDTAGSPLLGRLPPPQFMPFMGPPPPPFLNLPPPPFLSSVEMRPAPLGRMMSPPLGRYSPPPAQRERDRRDYRDDPYDYGDSDEFDTEDDYDYDDDEDMPRHRRHRRLSGNGSDSWRRDNYSPPPPDRSYRSQSPEDSRYNYKVDRDLMSTYETDLSPPSSPPERGGISGGGDLRTGKYAYSPQSSKESTKAAKKSGKGIFCESVYLCIENSDQESGDGS